MSIYEESKTWLTHESYLFAILVTNAVYILQSGKNKHFDTDPIFMIVDTMIYSKTSVEVKKVNKQDVLTKWKYSNYIYISCGLANEMVACFCKVCVTEKKSYHIWGQFLKWLSIYNKKYDVTSHLFI